MNGAGYNSETFCLYETTSLVPGMSGLTRMSMQTYAV